MAVVNGPTGMFGIPSELENPLRISSLLFTTTPLGGGGTVTVGPEAVNFLGVLVGSVFSDVAGTLFVEQTNDAVNFDDSQTFIIPAGVGIGFEVKIRGFQQRLRYVNGVGAQATFRLFGCYRGI